MMQRVPVTEKSGRVHTSAASVAVLPQADEVWAHNWMDIEKETKTVLTWDWAFVLLPTDWKKEVQRGDSV
jgi:hypothetical protein